MNEKLNSASSDSDVEASDDEQLMEAFHTKKLKPGLYRLNVANKKEFKNDTVGMEKKLEQIKLNLPWIERLDMINAPAPLAPELYVQDEKEKSDDIAHDDFRRELMFYRQAQAAVLEAIPRLHQLGVKTKRPEDYFAQMIKSDDHMKKVRETLLNKEAALEQREKAKKLRELKKYGKQVQREVLQKRQADKKEMMSKIKKQKIKRSQDEQGFTSALPSNTNTTKTNRPQNKTLNNKRKMKDQKYGRGGPKKRSKYNTAESSADVFSGFQPKKGRRMQKGDKKGMKGPKQRIGKHRRQKLKNRKR